MRNLVLIALVVLVGIHPAAAEDRRIIAGKDVDGWIAVLRDPAKSDRERQAAIGVLGDFGPEAKAAVPLLIDRFIKLGCQHYTGMGSFGFDPSVKMALVKIGEPSVPVLVEILNGPDTAMRVCAAEALGEIGPAAKAAVPRLIQAVERPEETMDGSTLRDHAIRTLGKIGPEARAAVPTLMGLVGRDNDSADLEVVVALDQIGSPPAAKLVDLFLREADQFVLEGDSLTTTCLFYLGPKARAEAPRIRALLTDNRLALRYEAAAILTRINPSDTAALPVLIEALNHDPNEEGFRYYSVIESLAWLGPRAKAAMPGLIAWARKAPDTEDLCRTLVTIDPDNPACVPLLIEALKQGDYFLVYQAIGCLGLLGPRARDAVPALLEVIRNRTGKRTTDREFLWSTIEIAIRAVGRIDPESPEVIAALIQVIEGATALGKTPPPESDFSTFDNDPTEAAARVLGSIGPKAKAAVPALIARLRAPTDHDSGFDEIIWTLGKIGPEASAAVPILRELASGKDRNPAAVLLALHRIEPDNKDWLDRLEKGLSRSSRGSMPEWIYFNGLRYQARILGALGRSSAETDGLVHAFLKQLDAMSPVSSDPRDSVDPEFFESWIESLGDFGPAAREAIPRLTEYRRHRDPWVRLWATEVLRQITPIAPTK